MARLPPYSKYCVVWRDFALASLNVWSRLRALHGLLRHAVHDRRLRQPGGLQHRRGQVDDVLKLGANLTLRLDPLRPVDHGGVARRGKRRMALPADHRRAARLSPWHGVVPAGFRSTQIVDVLQQVLHRFGHAVERGQLVERPDRTTEGRPAVVAGDPDDQGVVQFAEVLDGLNQSTDLVVGVLGHARRRLPSPAPGLAAPPA